MTRTAPDPNALPNALRPFSIALFLGLAAWLLVTGTAWAQEGYSYVRTVEGYVSLESVDEGTLEAVENQPLIPGDALVVGTSSRVEAMLADGAVLRLGGRSDLRLDALALTPDTGDASTRLFLSEGELQVVLGQDVEGPLEVGTGNATIYLEAAGAYRIDATGDDRTSVVVREGFAEVQTDRGSAILRSGEAGYIDGADWASVEVARADRRTGLENWGDELDAEAQLAEMPYVEPGLQYRAARMANYGAWIEIGDRRGWRPHVSVGWRPYVNGAWRYTPSGLTWVSNEPWGWVPSHYGTWDLVPGYGWTWFAGSHYSPASVYWYWGPTHVGWVPAGYYTSFYSSRHHVVPRLGIYGWAGGSWSFFADWTFCPTRYFGRSRYDRYFRSGHEIGRHASYRDIPRGVIATDTRSLRRDVWGQPDRIATRLIAADSRLSAGSLPDVTDFVARRKDVSPKIAEIVRPREIATLRSRSRATSAQGSRRSSVIALEGQERRGRPTVQRRVVGEAPRDEARRSRSLEQPRSVDSPSRSVLNRGTYGRPLVERQGTDRTRLDRRGAPANDRVKTEGSRIQPNRGRPDRSSGGTADRVEPRSGDDRAVVRRVIERMRSRQAPAQSRSSTKATPSSPPPRASSSNRSRQSTSRQGAPARSSSSRARSPSGSSRSSEASKSSAKPARSKSARSRTSSRKPPAGEG